MAEILGLGCTHRPVMLRRNEDWTGMMRTSLDDPDMPAEMKDPARWPAQLREELGNDWGAGAAGRAREVYRRHFADTRAALDEFKPDVIVMFGDDQYENFKEDVVPPFAVLAYEGHEIEPWKSRAWNPWGEPNDKRFSFTGHRAAGKYLASGLLELGIGSGTCPISSPETLSPPAGYAELTARSMLSSCGSFPRRCAEPAKASARGTVKPDGVMTNATVGTVSQTVDGGVIRVTYKGGESEYTVGPEVPVLAYVLADTSLLKPGAAVLTVALKKADGSLVTSRVTAEKDGVKPPM
jgi:hypothetical protein